MTLAASISSRRALLEAELARSNKIQFPIVVNNGAARAAAAGRKRKASDSVPRLRVVPGA
jgi:hypothetical protein